MALIPGGHLRPDFPPGTIIMYAGGTTPSGWLLCDGSAVSRSTYQALFAAIGTTYGAGDGSTTFNLPNFQAQGATAMRVPAGAGTGFALGATAVALSNAATTQGSALAVNFLIRF